MIDITIRLIEANDAQACGKIIYEAFSGIAAKHGFRSDIPEEKVGIGIAGMLSANPKVYGVVAEYNNKIIGSNFIDERNPIRGIGPITVAPEFQNKGIGRKLMEVVIKRGQDAPGIRLVQDTFNVASVSLYTSLGFSIKEPLMLMTGKPRSKPSDGILIRQMKNEDAEECNALYKKVHGFDRLNEIRENLNHFAGFVAVRDDEVKAYLTSPTFWLQNHGVAEREEDMKELILGAGSLSSQQLSFLLPTRQSSLFRWCLNEGFRAISPRTLMAMGRYNEPKGVFMPSINY